MNETEKGKLTSALRLVVTGEEHLPIYLQLVQQIRYLVTSKELPTGAQLPSVRILAANLGINAGTVAQAYRVLKEEGLIETRQGLGTFVIHPPDAALSLGTRQLKLAELVDATIARAFAMGFERHQIRQHVHANLQQQIRTVPIVLVAPTSSAAHKYSHLVSKALPPEVVAPITTCTFTEISAGDPRVLAAYQRAYFTVVAFVSSIPIVEEALSGFGVDSELIGLTAVLSENTVRRLGELDPTQNHVLLTEVRNVNSALGLLGKHSPLNLSSLQILTELSSDDQFREVTGDTLIYTFGVSELLEQQDIPVARTLELNFTLSRESAERLGSLIPQAEPVPG